MKKNTHLRPRRPLALCCLCFLLFLFAVLMLVPAERETAWGKDGERIVVSGRVTRKEKQKKPDGTIHRIVYLEVTGGSEKTVLQCYLSGDSPGVHAGEAIRVGGKYREFSKPTNPGEFDTAFYYRVQGIGGRVTGAEILKRDGSCDYPGEVLSQLREHFADTLDQNFSAEDAGILRAMLLGDKSGLDPEIRELYQRSGIIHIIAISGLHITLIGMGLFHFLVRLRIKRRYAAGLCVLIMFSYGEMTGQASPATRALVMFLLRLLAMMTGRCYDVITALSLAAVLLVFEQPLYLQYSGFLLSFLAVLGVSVVRPQVTPARLLDRYPQRGDPPWMGAALKLSEGFFSSLSVTITTLPVYMLFFHTVSVYQILLNLLVLPLMPAVVLSGMSVMLLGSFFPGVGHPAGIPAHLLLQGVRIFCLAETSIPGAVWVTGHAAPWQATLYTLMLSGYVAVVYLVREKHHREKGDKKKKTSRTKRRNRWQQISAAAYLLLMVFIISFRSDPYLKITVLDVGQGDGIVVEYRDRCFLIDGGSSSRTGIGSYVIEPFLAYEGISVIDAAIVSHEDDDHINGLAQLLENTQSPVKIGMLCLPDVPEGARGENYERLVRLAENRGIPVTAISRGDVLMRGDLSIRCLGPPKSMTGEANEHSLILYLSCREMSALFTGDVEGAGEEALLETLAEMPEDVKNLTLLKVAHHGSGYTTSKAFLDRVDPGLAVISCGRNNRYGHPHPELLRRLVDCGAQIWQTAKRGAISFEAVPNGNTVRITGFLDASD